MTENSRLIVLTHTPFGEKSLVLHVITREWGRRGFLVKPGVRTPTILFQPMSLLEASVVGSGRSSLWTAHGFSASNPLSHIRSDIRKNAITMFMGEVLYRTIKDGMKEEGLFDWLEKEVMMLEAMEEDFSNFHISFLLDLASMMGFSPSEGDLAQFAGERRALLSRYMSLSIEEAMLMPLTGGQRSLVCDDILRYLEYHTESAIHIRSLSVLHSIFS